MLRFDNPQTRKRRGFSMRDKLIADGGTALFQPDSLLPTQFFTTLRQKSYTTGERRLMVAILEDAVECFQKYLWATSNRSRQLRADAEAWFLSDDTSWPFSFLNICEALDIHPLLFRQGLLRWKGQQLTQRQAASQRARTISMLDSELTSESKVQADHPSKAGRT